MSELIASADDGYDALLIDDRVPWTSGEPADWNAVRAVGAITEERGRNKPARILWASDADALRIYSFCAFGGHNYVNKNEDALVRRTCDTVRRTAAGERWVTTPTPLADPEQHKLLCRFRRLLALLKEGWHEREIAAVLGYAESTIRDAKTKLARALVIDPTGGGYASRLPEAAKERGYYWVPYDWWRYDPRDRPLWPDEEPSGLRDAH